METKRIPPATDPLEGLTVGAFATIGMVECPPDASLYDVASLMSTHLVHAVIVDDGTDRGVIADGDLISAAASGQFDHLLAGDISGTEMVAVTYDETLFRASQIMAEHSLTHLVVRRADGTPVGVLSTIDLARAIALRV
jgi:CBS domain-containing protein